MRTGVDEDAGMPFDGEESLGLAGKIEQVCPLAVEEADGDSLRFEPRPERRGFKPADFGHDFKRIVKTGFKRRDDGQGEKAKDGEKSESEPRRSSRAGGDNPSDRTHRVPFLQAVCH